MTQVSVVHADSSAAIVADQVCKKIGHRIAVFVEPELRILCTQCGMTLEEIRKGVS